MKRQVFDMEMDQKPLPSGYLTDCHGKKTFINGLPWFTYKKWVDLSMANC